MKKYKEYDLPYTLDKDDFDNRDKIKSNFIKNMDACKELRLDIWEKVYGRKWFRKDKGSIEECENEWLSFDQAKKEEWFDFVTDKDLSFIQEIFFIGNLVKQYKGNVIKATREYKKFLKEQKKKKQEYEEKYSKPEIVDEEEEEEEEEEEKQEEDFDSDDEDFDSDSDDSSNYYGDGEVPSNSLGLAALAAKDSETLKFFKELPKEVKHSFYDDKDLREVRHRLKCFKDFRYIIKNLKIQALEDKKFIENKNKLYTIKTKEQLENYYKNINKYYMYKQIENAGMIDQLLEDIKTIKDNGLSTDLYNSNENVKELFDEYLDINKTPEFIDDVGNLGTVMDYSVTSSGKAGNERLAGITAIQATRDIDLRQKAESQTKYNMLTSFLKKFG